MDKYTQVENGNSEFLLSKKLEQEEEEDKRVLGRIQYKII